MATIQIVNEFFLIRKVTIVNKAINLRVMVLKSLDLLH